MPWWSFIRSPTTAIFTMLSSTLAGATRDRLISNSNSWSIAFFAVLASSAFTPKQMECSEEAWVIIMMFMCWLDKHSNKRLENPGIPTIPLPSKFNNATFSI